MIKQLSLTADDFTELTSLYDRISEIGQDVADKILEIYCLYQIAAGLSTSMDLRTAVDVLERLFRHTLRAEAYALLVFEGREDHLTPVGHFGLSPQALKQLTRFLNNLPRAILFDGNKPKSLATILQDCQVTIDQTAGFPMPFNTNALLSPLFGDADLPLGLLLVTRKADKPFTEPELRILEKISAQLGKGIEKIQTFEHTRELSITDDLTQIFNRRYFNQRFEREMERAIRYNRPLTVIMADIDHFKSLNDTYGHFYGDEVLKTVATILDGNLRRADILARFGGEEFVILLPEIDKDHGKRVAEKLRQAVETYPFAKGSPLNENRVTLSLGLAAFPEDALNGGQLLEFADRALYQAKSQGRNCVIAYQKKNGKMAPFSQRYRLAAAGTRA